ncbi:hypothetical protein [Streptomyces xiamenensis]|uniref:hypothetical protein n=1 Tax=Streptomyces xiamenensis TaxID=408015 RepID=UPI0035DA8402
MRTLKHKTALLGTTGALALLAACSTATGDGATGPTPHAHQEPQTPQTAITNTEAQQVIADYNEQRNAAYRALDATLVEEIEGGSVLQRNRADMEQYLGLPEADRRPIEDWDYADPEIYIPAGETWWMAKAGYTRGESQALLTFERGQEDDWLLVAAVPLATDLPAIALDEQGLAEAVSADDPAGELLPQDAAAAYEDLWETGGTGPGAPLATSAGGQDVLERRSPEDPLLLARYTATTPDHEHTWSLRTEDGGTLTVATTAHTESMTDVFGAPLTPRDASAHYNSTPRSPLIAHYTGEIAVSIPADTAPQILGDRWKLIGSE